MSLCVASRCVACSVHEAQTVAVLSACGVDSEASDSEGNAELLLKARFSDGIYGSLVGAGFSVHLIILLDKLN